MSQLIPEAASLKTIQNTAVVMNLTDEQRLLLCDLGYYNEVMRGYLIRTLKAIGYADSVIDTALDQFEQALDGCNAEEARAIYRSYEKNK